MFFFDVIYMLFFKYFECYSNGLGVCIKWIKKFVWGVYLFSIWVVIYKLEILGFWLFCIFKEICLYYEDIKKF